MRAMLLNAAGEAFTLEETPLPAPGPGQVRLRVRASSVNPIDCKLRSGMVPLIGRFPAILHVDVAGEVGAIGSGVSGFNEGDRVFGFAGGILGYPGALAEYACVPAAALAHLPDALDFAEAAVLPVAGATAWEALFERVALKPGMRVLIHAGSGGVGHLAIQMARSLGVEVHTTVSSSAKAELVRQLGADVVINYRQQEVADYVRMHTAGKGYDVVLDTVGGANLQRSLMAATPGGRVVSIAARGVHDLTSMHAKGLGLEVVFSLRPFVEDTGFGNLGQRLRALSSAIDRGVIQPLLDERRFGFTEVNEAHAWLESGQAVGKVALINDL